MRYFFRVLLEKLNSSMCAMCFPVGPELCCFQLMAAAPPEVSVARSSQLLGRSRKRGQTKATRTSRQAQILEGFLKGWLDLAASQTWGPFLWVSLY